VLANPGGAFEIETLNIHRVRAFYGQYWQEDPAVALTRYRELLQAPFGLTLRRELIRSRMDVTSGGFMSPHLVTLRPSDGSRLEALWREFLGEMAASTNLELRLDAGMMLVACAVNPADLEADTRQLFDLLLRNRDTVERCAAEFDYRDRALKFLAQRCIFDFKPPNLRVTPPSPSNLRILNEWLPGFNRQWAESSPSTPTNSSAANIPKPELPGPAPQSGSPPIQTRRVGGSNVVRRTVAPPPSSSPRRPATNAPGMAGNRPPFGWRPSFPGQPGSASVTELLVETMVVDQFWCAVKPSEISGIFSSMTNLSGSNAKPPPDSELFARTRVAGFKYRDARLWIETRFEANPKDGRAAVQAVDLQTWAYKWYAIPQSWSIVERRGASRSGPGSFDAAANCLYTAILGRLSRLELSNQVWSEVDVPFQGEAEVNSLGEKLYLSSDDSILEVDPRSFEIRILASTRRRPAVNALDEMDRLRSPASWLGGEGIRMLVGTNVYEVRNGSTSCEVVCPLPAQRMRIASQTFERGILVHQVSDQGGRRVVALFDNDRAFETLLQEPSRGPGPMFSPATSKMARWTAPPQRSLVGSASFYDRTNLWCLAPPERRGATDALVMPPEPGGYYELSLTRFGPEPDSILTVPLRLKWDVQAPPGPGNRLQPFSSTLIHTPAGFVVADPTLKGFWLLPQETLRLRMQTQTVNNK
jgi:hypothetical protein